MFKKTTLPNGLRIITAPMQGTNTVTILVLCATGSDYESRELSGISHFLEHMFFKGTSKRPRPEMISEALDGMGAHYNAFTSHEVTGYYVKSGKVHFEKSLEILADIYKNSLLANEEIDRERQVIVEEMKRDRDLPTLYIWWLWERLLYGDQPAGWDVIGTEENIRVIPRGQFADYFHHQYTAPNTIVLIAGNIDEGNTVAAVTKEFADIRSDSPIRTKPKTAEEQAKPMLHIEPKNTDQTHLMIGFRGLPADHPKRYAADVLASILGDGMSSRMFQSVRERLGLVYTIRTVHEAYSDRGYLVTYAGCAHENVEKVTSAILEEYKKIVEKSVTEEELRRVKEYIKGSTLIGLEASDAVANFIGSEEILTGRPLTVDEVFAKIEALSSADIRDVAADLIRPERLNFQAISPIQDSKPLERLLTL